MRIRNHRDFWSGAMFLVLGTLFTGLSLAYRVGTPARMGPGFFPAALGTLLAILGAAIVWRSLAPGAREAQVGGIGWREAALVLLAVGLFAATLQTLGLVVAVVLLIGISALASHEHNWKETVASIVVLLALSTLVFVRGLELQLPVWPTFPMH